MLFHSSLRKELARTFGATLVVLVTIVMTIILIRTLGLASKGSVNPSDVFLVMAYTVIGYMPTILSLSLFVAIVGTLSRMYRDSEMVIWLSSGQGLINLIKPLLRFSWPVLLLIAVFALVGWPWANGQTQGMRNQYERRSDIDRVAPGQFQESAGRNRVFYIDKDAPSATSASNVFIAALERNSQFVTSAQSGAIETLYDARYVMLHNGQRVENPLDQSGIKVSEFESYGTRVGANQALPSRVPPPRTLSSLELLAQPTRANQAELGWRIGMVLASLNLVLIALLVAGVNPRVGSSGNLMFALFSFILYYNLLNLGQNWVGSGRVSATVLVMGMHGSVLLGALLWLAKRQYGWRRPRLARTATA